ncbi:lactonase family protein [Psychrosphaera sp. 1_MG-2023]|uniref:lactonase family protein n=1 Tax=Psychrosphaera sp. 1_MG-2023 TaxID=3062643 RepID=UPI0026E46DF5|nr:lactonase family protein [Psychrosphaera sp. 1_MG-2023]MDO6718796.1 lactonase family protein [Psychrosphaera sp. 1_MG-2023]
MNKGLRIARNLNKVAKNIIRPFIMATCAISLASCHPPSLSEGKLLSSNLIESTDLMEKTTDKDYFLVGGYNKNPDDGISLVSYNSTTNRLVNEKVVANTLNPSYLNWQQKQKTLYSIATTADKSPLLQVYQWQKAKKQFALVHSQEVLGKGICHVNVNQDQSQLAIVNYTSGESSFYALKSPSAQPSLIGHFKNYGHSKTKRQKSAHLHYAGWGNQNRYVYLTDLGTDEIIVFDSLATKIEPKFRIKLTPGDGPRHLAFHPTKNTVYSLNELSNSITVFTQNENTGNLTFVDKVMLFNENINTKNTIASAIRVTQDGKYLYTASRGENMIYGFAIQANGQLKFVNKVSSGGEHPRDFNFSSNQSYLLVANQHANQINLVKRDTETGQLTLTEISTVINNPSFIQAFN